MSKESVKAPVTSDNSFVLKLTLICNGKIGVKFEGSWLKQDKISCNHRKAVNLFIFYELHTRPRDTDVSLCDSYYVIVYLVLLSWLKILPKINMVTVVIALL